MLDHSSILAASICKSHLFPKILFNEGNLPICTSSDAADLSVSGSLIKSIRNLLLNSNPLYNRVSSGDLMILFTYFTQVSRPSPIAASDIFGKLKQKMKCYQRSKVVPFAITKHM